MIDRKIYNDDFEDLIREKTDQYKMYPSDKVWKEVYSSLHTRRRRFVLGMSVLIAGILGIAGKELLAPSKVNHIVKQTGKSEPGSTPGIINQSDLAAVSNNASLFSPLRTNEPSRLNRSNKGNQVSRVTEDENNTTESIAEDAPDHILVAASVLYSQQARPVTVEISNQSADKKIAYFGSPDQGISVFDNAADQKPEAGESMRLYEAQSKESAVDASGLSVARGNPAVSTSSLPEPGRPVAADLTAKIELSRQEMARQAAQRNTMRAADGSLPTATGASIAVVPSSQIRSNMEAAKENKAVSAVISNSEEGDRQQIGWLLDNAVQHLTPIKKNRLSWQAYLSPTVTYRNLSGGDNSSVKTTVQNVPMSFFHFSNVSDFVDHSPSLGVEAGGNILYHLTRNLSLKAGLQFNYSRYLIKAYSSNGLPAQNTLNTLYGYLSDSITGLSAPRNLGGKSVKILENQYFQISAPVGIELRVFGNGNLQLGIAGTIQPTILLDRNNYLLSNDYTSYIKSPSSFRTWNLNAGVEVFISYQVGSVRFQLGPQLRYQLFSTYSNDYPIRENLKQYGIKLAITKAVRH